MELLAEVAQHRQELKRPLTASVGPAWSDRARDMDVQPARPTTTKDNKSAPTNTNMRVLRAQGMRPNPKAAAIRGNHSS